jgi:hypothetical protein
LKFNKNKIKDISTFTYLFVVIFCLTYRDWNDITSRVLLFWPGFILLLCGLYAVSILLLLKLSRGHVLYFDIKVIIGFLILCLYILASSIISYDKLVINVFIMNVLLVILILIYILNTSMSIVDISIRLSKMFAYLAVMFSIVAILVNYNILNLEIGAFILRPNPTHYPRLHGITGEPTSLGGIAGVGILCSIYLIIKKCWTNKMRYSLFILFLFAVLIMSGSRMALISLIMSASLMILLSLGLIKLAKIYSSIGFISFVVISFSYYLYGDNLINYFVKIFRPEDIVQEDTRLNIWNITLKLYSNGSFSEILIGRGFQGLQTIYRSAHNVYLEFLFDYGIVFILLFLIYIGLLYRKAISALKRTIYREPAILACTLLAYTLIFSMFLSTLITKNFYIINFLFICTLVMISRLEMKKTNRLT